MVSGKILFIHENEEFPEETKMLIAEFLHPKLKRIFEENEGKTHFYLPAGKKFTTQNLEAIELSSNGPEIEFNLFASTAMKN